MKPRTRNVFKALRGTSGTTLVELSVAMAILGVVITITLGILVWVQTALGRENIRSTTMDQGRLAMESLDRDIRSGNILCEQSGYYGMSVYTQSNGTARWVQYRVQSQVLQRREYGSSWGSWRTVATGVVNTTPSGTTDVPFILDTSAASGSRVMNITLLINSSSSNVASKTVRIQSSLAIRNQSTANPCSSVPSG